LGLIFFAFLLVTDVVKTMYFIAFKFQVWKKFTADSQIMF